MRTGGQGAKRVNAALQVRPGNEKNTKMETGMEGTTLVSSGNQEITGVYTSYMTVAKDEGEAEFHVKHRFTPLSAKLKESLAGWLAPQEAEAYQHKAENQKTKGIEH